MSLNNPGKPAKNVYDIQDDLLLSILNKKPLKTDKLRCMPPLRAFLIAEIAAMANVSLEEGTFEQLRAEVKRVGQNGVLGEWWNRYVLWTPIEQDVYC